LAQNLLIFKPIGPMWAFAAGSGIGRGKAAPPATVRGKLLPLERDLTQEETFMSPLAFPSAAALPAINVHPHGHGHKKGSAVDSAADSSSATAGQSPVGSTQNLFSNLFNSLAQVIGARPAQATLATRVTQAAGPAQSQSAQAAQLAIGSKINTTA
jgi:hypothetical protein